jgi:CubicO group peptidase (beta-lactamase class C family)
MTFLRNFLLALVLGASAASAQTAPLQIDGLWAAHVRYGPDVRGPVMVERREGTLYLEIGGRRVTAREENGEVIFALPNDLGGFRGRFSDRDRVLRGHWIQQQMMSNGAQMASPLSLVRDARGRWRGEVAPIDDTMTLYLDIRTDEQGVLRSHLRNPERNIGVFQQIDRIERRGDHLSIIGRFRGRGDEQVFAEADYDRNNDLMPFHFPGFGVTVDFAQATTEDERGFYASGVREPDAYAYAPPPALDDGWRTGALEDAGIDPARITAFVDMLNRGENGLGTPQIHGLVIARRGVLVFEHYFRGFHRDSLHDTRSASKSMAAILTGAAIRRGAPFTLQSPVVESVEPALLPAEIDPRMRAMRIEHLLTMSPGFNCDDSDSASPGNEDAMQEQRAEPNWWRFALAVPMAHDPGERAAYCSMTPNLVGAVVSHETGRWLPELFDEQVARPLDIQRYSLNLTPTGDWYLGGGARFRLRDFLKMAQLVLDGGEWNGRRVLSREYAAQMAAPLVQISDRTYGYFWWSQDYPYGDRSVRAVYAAGNGGQIIMAIPDLDLAVGFFGGNYSEGAALTTQRVYIPEYILPAVR